MTWGYDMDATKCEAFLVAAEQGSLTAAGRQLGYTQPGITRMIRSLEAEVGFPLLVRTARGVTPTANGRAMEPLFREVVRAERSAEEAGSQIRGMLSGVLTVGSYFSVYATVLPEVLRGFGEAYPKVGVRLREGSNQELDHWLAERSVDCCFAPEPAADLGCDWIPLVEDELVAWLPKDHPLAGAEAFPVHAFDGAPFVITNPGQDTDIDRLIRRYDLKPDLRFSTRDAYTTWRMVEAGLGVSMNQRLISRRWEGEVAQVPFDPPQPLALGISVPSLTEASPATRAFVACVRETLAGE